MKYLLFTTLSMALFFSCKSDPTPNTESQDQPVEVEKQLPTELTVGIDNLRLRESAGESGKHIGYLKQGTKVTETGAVSDFTTRIKLRGIWFDEPWLKVRTSDGQEGWVYAGGLTFETEQGTELSEKLLDLRLQSFFGKGLTREIHSYRKAFNSTTTSSDFSNLFKKGEQLRDTMVSILENKINVVELDYEQLPDLFWVEAGLPGYETALVAEGTIYYLFQNYKVFKKLSSKTSGTEDDDFIDLNLKVHASDSIEYFFPAWFLQTWDYGGHSLLGQGVHADILKKADQTVKKSNFFLEEIMDMKNRMVEDMVGEGWTYWEPAEKIKKELDDILKADLSILSKEDIIALETRRKMFEDPKANNIKVNQKSGLEGMEQ